MAMRLVYQATGDLYVIMITIRYNCTQVKTLAQQAITDFFRDRENRRYGKGHILFGADADPDKAYFIRSGYVRSYSITPEGVELTVHIFSPLSCFPMMSILAGLSNRYFYEALTDIEISTAPKTEVAQFIRSNQTVLLDLATRLLSGLDKLTMRIEYLALQNSQKRTISALLFLAKHFGTREGNSVTFLEAFTHRDIASFAGISRETASREWGKLADSGLVGTENKKIVIHDMERLTALGAM